MDEWINAYNKVQADNDDFEKWQDLIETAESLEGGLNKTSALENIELLRFTYDKFVEKFPMLQGFWIKYAQWEFKLGFNEKALQVYERALSMLPACVDLWTRYCKFKALITHEPEYVRRLFQRAAGVIGNHFYSHEFWDAYIEFEEINGNNDDNGVENVYYILDEIVRIPIHQYARFFDRYRKTARLLPPEMTIDEFKLTQFKAEYELEKEEKLVNQNISPDYDLRVRINVYHEQIYEETKWAVAKRWPFEQAIKRQYFDILYLEEAQVVNWRKYLQFEKIEEDGLEELLYERALIPMALHEEIWLDYLRYLLSKSKFEQARIIFQRACRILPIGRPNVRHMFARFLESEGEYEEAKEIYQSILTILPNSLETIVLLGGNILRTEKNIQNVQQLFDNCISTAIGEECGFLISELAKISTKHYKSPEFAKKLYQSFETKHSSFIYWREYLKFAINLKDDQLVQKVYQMIEQQSELHPRQIKDLGHYYMEYSLTNLNAPHEFLRVDSQVHKSAALTL